MLRKLLTGEYRTCLLYSEPGAGSDIAGLQTRAERDGAEWIVNGQKVWTSGARTATHGLLAARTNWDVPKHRGITYFLLPMQQPGVEVRPIKQMTGHQTFNEVFFTDARVPDSLRISDVDDGWRVLNAALAVERMAMGGGLERSRGPPGGHRPRPSGRHPSQPGAERPRPPEADAGPPPEVRIRPVDLVAVANDTGRGGDPVIRQAIARMHALRRISRWNAERAEGSADMSVATVLKLSMSEILHGSARIHAQLIGTEAMLTGQQSPQGEIANQTGMWAFINSIGGGSDQIQRNLIGERVLGLPHDPSADRDVPFRDVRKASGVRPLGQAQADGASRRAEGRDGFSSLGGEETDGKRLTGVKLGIGLHVDEGVHPGPFRQLDDAGHAGGLAGAGVGDDPADQGGRSRGRLPVDVG